MMAGDLVVDQTPQKMGKTEIKLDRLRSLVKKYTEKNQYESALFWADKVATLSRGQEGDIYWHSHTLYLTGHYHRASHLLKSKGLDKKYLSCRHLAARCHYDTKEYQEALNILDQTATSGGSLGSSRVTWDSDTPENASGIPADNMESAINLLRGKVYEAMDNRNLASECFREALRGDVFCYEAFENLVNHHMLSAQEEQELLDSLQYRTQCEEGEAELLQYLYETKVKKYNCPGELRVPESLDILNDNPDTTVCLAERHYYNCDFRQAYTIATHVLQKDPYNSQCLPIHIATLYELGKSNELFYMAHKLVAMYPNKAVSWFAVGCYYLLVGKNDPARRYLDKATTVDRVFGPAWLAFGHSFATENEHDQAMAAYFTASKLMKGCHLPVLYIGLEYGLTNDPKLAERFFSQARAIAPDDPFVLHEIGTVAFWNHDYVTAEVFFKSALEKVESVSDVCDKWEPLLNNLGHVCRKLKKYSEALEYHRQALILSPQNPSTLSAMGFIHALMGNTLQAINYFHKAIGLRRDDTFSTSMLDQLVADMPPIDGFEDELPPYTYDGTLEPISPASRKSEPLEGEEANSPALAAVETTLGDSSLGDASMADNSSMAIDTDMDDICDIWSE